MVRLDAQSRGCVSVFSRTGGQQAATVRGFSQRGGAEKCDDASVVQLPFIHRDSWMSGAVAGVHLAPKTRNISLKKKKKKVKETQLEW